MSEVTERDAVRFVLMPLETLNSANANSLLLRVNEKVLNEITKAKKILTEYNTSEVSIKLAEIESDVILLSNEFSSMNVDDDTISKLELLKTQLDAENFVETIVDFDDKTFNELQEDHTVNWAENLKFVLTENGFYITDKFELDALETLMVEYSILK